MGTHYAETHIRALQLAKQCVDMGARIRTVSRITGLELPMLRSLFYQDTSSAPGRWLESSDWYHRSSVVDRAEAGDMKGSMDMPAMGMTGLPITMTVHRHYFLLGG